MKIPPRHEWNDDFAWQQRKTRSDGLLTDASIHQFNQQGFLVLRDVVPPAMINQITDIIDDLEARDPRTVLQMDGQPDVVFDQSKFTFACNLAGKNALLNDFATGPVFQNILRDLIGEDVRLYWDQAVYKKPDQRASFAWHQDNGYTYTEPQDYLTCWLALTDADASNGCPWILPGLHREGTFMHEHGDEGLIISELHAEDIGDNALCAPVPAGSMVIFSSLTPHMTGPNLTDKTRKAYILQYITDGAVLRTGDGKRHPLNDPVNNPVVLRDGKPVNGAATERG